MIPRIRLWRIVCRGATVYVDAPTRALARIAFRFGWPCYWGEPFTCAVVRSRRILAARGLR